MAIDVQVTTALRVDNAPAGHVAPTTTHNLGSSTNEVTFTRTVASSGLTDPATPATTMAAILAALDTWLTTVHMPTTLGISVALTVTAIATVRTISRNNSGYTKNSDPAIYLTGTDNFVIKGTLRWLAV